jgi:GNAT superfamily N-acetyltransferase
MSIPDLTIAPATERDVPLLLSLIKSLAEYERLSDRVVATEADLRESLFGRHPAAEVVIAHVGREAAGYALWFHTFSTFLGKRGLYLEDLFVVPPWRSKGIGRALLAHLAGIAIERDCGRLEWSVLTWNESAIRFYESTGATAISDWTVYRLAGDALSKMAQSRGTTV